MAGGIRLAGNQTVELEELEQQIRIEGEVIKVEESVSDNYFDARPVESRYAAMISDQSKTIDSRASLDKSFEKISFSGEVPRRPQNWGGYILKPIRFEFWQGRENRLHDRIIYELEANNWNISRLAP